MKKLERIFKKITTAALVTLALQPLLGLAVLPAKTYAAVASYVVISEVQTASDEFIELYNPTASAVPLSGWSIQYRSGSSVSFLKKNFESSASIPSNGFYLIARSDSTGITDEDMSHSTFLMSSTGGTVFLVNDQILLTTGTETSIVDKVGYGTGTLYPEITAVTAPSSGSSIERKANVSSTSVSMTGTGADALKGNAWDTGVNSDDFVSRTAPQPQNSTSSEDIIAPGAPDASKITVTQNAPGTDDSISGSAGAVVAGSKVRIYKDAAKTTKIGEVTSTMLGSFATTSIGDNQADAANLVYVTVTDANDNESLTTSVSNDITPPGEVTGLTATGGNNLATLSWTNPIGSSDFAGVNIYRSTVSGELGSKLNTSVIPGTNFSDTTALNGTTYYYTAKTVDEAGNESLGLAQVSATPAAPVVLSPVVPTTSVVTAVAEVPVNETFGGSSEQGEVKADTTISQDSGNQEENKEEQKEDTKGKKNIPLWGIIFLLVLAGIGGYLFYSQSPVQDTKVSKGKKK